MEPISSGVGGRRRRLRLAPDRRGSVRGAGKPRSIDGAQSAKKGQMLRVWPFHGLGSVVPWVSDWRSDTGTSPVELPVDAHPHHVDIAVAVADVLQPQGSGLGELALDAEAVH